MDFVGRHMRPITTLLLLFCVIHPTKALADPFSIKPDGSLVANVAFATHGVFFCDDPGIACSGSGTSSVMLGSGANIVSLSFVGADTTVAVSNVATPVTLGTFSTSGARAFPSLPNPNVPILRFEFSLTQTSPVSDTANPRWFFGPGGGAALPLLRGPDYLQTAVGPNPPPFAYRGIVFSIAPFPFSIPNQGMTPFTADAGLVPEPTTLMLAATGLIGAVRARRRTETKQAIK